MDWKRKQKSGLSISGYQESDVSWLSPDEQERFDELAGKFEYDAGMPRRAAERRAWRILQHEAKLRGAAESRDNRSA